MLRAQIIRICKVEMKIWGFTPSSGAFSKWLSRRKSRKPKKWNFCISTSNYHRYTQSISRYIWGTELSGTLSRRAANPQVLYLRSLMTPPPPPPTHLVCNAHLIANFLRFHMSLVVVMNCGAGNALRGFEISMFYFFIKLYFIHISKDILPLRAQNAIKQCK